MGRPWGTNAQKLDFHCNFQVFYATASAAAARRHGGKDNLAPAEDLHNKNPSLVALGKKKKGQLKTLREEEERKREANFVAETQRLMSIIREMREGESSSTEEEKLREKECAEKEERRARLARKKAAKELHQAITSNLREVGEARMERRPKKSTNCCCRFYVL